MADAISVDQNAHLASTLPERKSWSMQCQGDLVVPLLRRVFGGEVSEWDLMYREVDMLGGIDKLVRSADGRTATVACRSRTRSRPTERKHDVTLRETSNGFPSELYHFGAIFNLYVATNARSLLERATKARWWILSDLIKLHDLIDRDPGLPGTWPLIPNPISRETFRAVPVDWMREQGLIVAESPRWAGEFVPGDPLSRVETHVARRLLEFQGARIRAYTLDDFGEG